MKIKESTRPLLDITEKAVDVIALSRAAATVIDGVAEEDFDKFLNDQCEKAFARYAGKGKREIIGMMVAQVAERDPLLILDLLMGGSDESDL